MEMLWESNSQISKNLQVQDQEYSNPLETNQDKHQSLTLPSSNLNLLTSAIATPQEDWQPNKALKICFKTPLRERGQP